MAALTENVQLASLLKGIFGGETTETSSGKTTTKSTTLDQAGINAMLKTLMENVQGLSSISSGQRSAGMYNSTVQSMLLNDLLSRSTASIAEKTATTTETTSPTTRTAVTPGIDLGTLGMLGGATYLLGKDSKTGERGYEEVFKKAKNIFGEGTDAADAATSSVSSIADTGASLSDFVGDIGSQADIMANDWIDFGGDFLESFAGDAASSAFDISGVSWFSGVDDLLAGDVTGAAEDVLGATLGTALGGPVGGFIGANIAEPVFEAASDIVEDIGDALGCFITTAVCKVLGKPDNCYELETLRKYRDSWLTENHAEDISHYYVIAPKIVKAIAGMNNAKEVFAKLNTDYISKAISAIEAGKNEEAYAIYKDMVSYAENLALSK